MLFLSCRSFPFTKLICIILCKLAKQVSNAIDELLLHHNFFRNRETAQRHTVTQETNVLRSQR